MDLAADITRRDTQNDVSTLQSTKSYCRKNFFPFKLMEMLSSPSFADCVRWTEDGKAFFFQDREKFTQMNVSMNSRKKTGKKNSFTRKLNRWGFRMELKKKSNYGMYSHELFQRDKPWLCTMMVCEKSVNSPKIQSDPQAMEFREYARNKRSTSDECDQEINADYGTQDRCAKKTKTNDELRLVVNDPDALSLTTRHENLISIDRKLLMTELLIFEKIKQMKMNMLMRHYMGEPYEPYGFHFINTNMNGRFP